MSELPRGWAATKLAEIAFPRGERVSPRSHEEKQFIGLEHVEAHSTRILGSIPASEVKSSASVFRAGDVLYGRLRPYLNKVAKPDFEGLASAEFIVFPDQEHLRAAFLKHRLNAGDFVSFATRLNAGDRPRVDFEQIGPFDIALPPAAEQQRIADKIDELLSDLDAGAAALERARVNLKRYRAAVLKAAVEGRLTEQWRAAHPDVEPADKLLERILAERRRKWEEAQLAKYAEKGQSLPKEWKKRYPEPVKPNVPALPALPEGWCWATIDQLATEVKNGTARAPTKEAVGHRILRINAVRPLSVDLGEVRHVDLPESEAREAAIRNGDLLFTRYNGSPELVGVAGLVRRLDQETLHPDKLIRVRALAIPSMQDYLEIACNVGFSREHVRRRTRTTAGQAGVSGADIKQIPIPMPPADEIGAVVEEAGRSLSLIGASEEEIAVGLQRAPRLRQSILKRAIEGKLVPQDPTDEPASELLARIRRAREEGAGREPARRAGRKAGGRVVSRQGIRQDS